MKSDPDQNLLQDKGGNGFPYLVFMDAEGNVIAKHSGDRSVAGFDKTGQKATDFLALKKKAEGGDKAAKIDLLLAQLEMGSIKAGDARAKLKELGELSKKQQEKFDGLLASLEVQEILKSVKDEKTHIEAGKKLLELKKAGKPAPTEEDQLAGYWVAIMVYAENQKDVETFEEGLTKLKEKFGSNPNAKNWFDKQEETLKKLKEEKDKKDK